MPTLDELQRQWLDLAVQNKGRFTRKASIEKDWENYRRRREKAALGGAGLLPDDPQKKLVDEGLKRADALAKDGKFNEAYKSLDQIKKIGAGASKERAKAVSIDGLNSRINVVRSTLDNIASNVDFVRRYYEQVLTRVANMTPASDENDLTAAVLRRKEILADEPALVAEMAERDKWAWKVSSEIQQGKIPQAIEEIARDINVHIAAGHGNEVSGYAQRLDQLRQKVAADPWYTKSDMTLTIVQGYRARFNTRLDELKSLDGFGSMVQTMPDGKTTDARKDLEGTDNSDWAEEDELERKRKAGLVMTLAGLQDKPVLGNTTEAPVKRAPELVEFDASALFDTMLGNMFPPNGEVPDDIPSDLARKLVEEGKKQISEVMARLDPQGDEMFDLMVSSVEDLKKRCSQALFGTDNGKGFSESHKMMLDQMAAELKTEVLKGSPNKMSNDGKEITVNGKTYRLESVVGEGANGAVRRYTDGEKTFVVKTLKGGMGGSEDKFVKMSEEMRTHRQVMGGQDDGVTDTDNLCQMLGGAVSEDGSLHMMMEEIEGGDVTSVANSYGLMANLGVLPRDAQKLLSLDLVAQTVKGMKAMQERGLVQNDLKPSNMMVTKDGKVKIIDFGESRFVDETTGQAPNALDGEYNTSPGYEAPEHYKRGQGVDSKADSFALGGIISILMDPNVSEGALQREDKGVSSLGRVLSGLRDEDPSKRPSLDSVLMSSLLDQLNTDTTPEDLEDLKTAAAEMNMALKGVKFSISAKDLQENVPVGKGNVDTIWVPFMAKGLVEGTEVPLAAAQTMVSKLHQSIEENRKTAQRVGPGERDDYIAKMKQAEKQRDFWIKEINRQTEALRKAGLDEVNELLNDEFAEFDLKGVGRVTMPEANKLRQQNTAEIKRLQDEFYKVLQEDPQKAQGMMDTTNARLTELDAQNRRINEEIAKVAGPKGKFFLAEQKLSEVSARFGPRRERGEDIKDRLTDKPQPKGTDAPPSDGKIPDPPEMPKEKIQDK